MSQQKAKKINKLLLWLQVIIGAGLVVFLFLYLIPVEKRNPITWLNFSMLLWVVVLSFVVFNILALNAKKNTDPLPAFLMVGTIVFFYDIVTVGIVLLSFAPVSIKLLVTAHSICGFLFLSAVILAFVTLTTAKSIQAEQKENRGKITDLRAAFETALLQVNRLPDDLKDLKKDFINVKDEVRYISPSGDPEATKYENDIANSLEKLMKSIEDLIENQNEDKLKEAKSLLSEILDIIKVRKKIYA